MTNKLLRVITLMFTLCISVMQAQINSTTAVVPFNSNPGYGTNGPLPATLPTGGQFGKSQDAANAYNEWKANYTEPCNDGSIRVRFDEPNRTVSEGIAYGMMLSVYAADKALFDKLWQYYKAKSNGNGFMHWRIEGCNNNSGNNGATDAELDATYALLLAANQWPTATSPYNYSTEATSMMNRIRQLEINSSGQAINGDGWGFGDPCRNPSYQSPSYYKEFAIKNPGNASAWNGAVSGAYTLINANADNTTGLVSDWSSPSGQRNTCNPGGLGQAATDGYGYDACRNPLRMAQDVLWNNDAQAKSICTKIGTYITGRGVNNIGGPLYQNGNNYPGYASNATFISTFGMAAMGSGNQTLINSIYTRVVNTKDQIQNSTLSGYYGNTLRCLALFMMSGNMWKVGTTSEREINIRQATIQVPNASTFDFQNGQINNNKDVVFTIENLGFTSLSLTPSPVVTITGDASYTIQTQPASTTLALGTTTTFTIRFRPATTGTKLASITIRSNDADETNYVINLTGVGTLNPTAPRLVVKDVNTVLSSPASVPMGSFTTSARGYKTIKVINRGDAPLNITGATVTGTNPTFFSVLFPTVYPLAVAVNDSAYLTLGYIAAASAANHSSTITIATNDPASASFAFNLTASSAACGPVVAASKILMDYDGNINVSQPFAPTGTWSATAPNPLRNNLNLSPTVASYVRATIGDYDIIRYRPCGTTNFTISANTPSISMLIYSPAVGIEVVCAAQKTGTPNPLPIYPDYSSNITVTTTKANQWEVLTFDFSRLITTNDVANFTIMDFQIDPLRKYTSLPANAAAAARTFYIDEIKYSDNPCLSDNSGILLNYDVNNNLFRTSFFNITSPVANPSKTGLNTSDLVGRFDKVAATINYSDGNRFNGCNNKVDFSTRKFVSMLVYATNTGAPILLNAKVPDGADVGTDPDDAATATAQTTIANQWHRLYFDLSAISVANIPNVFGLDLFIDPLATKGAGTYYIDDIRFETELPCLAQIPLTGVFNDFDANRNVDLDFQPIGTINQASANPSTIGNPSAGVASFIRAIDGSAATAGNQPDILRYKACGLNYNFSAGRSVVSLDVYSPNAGTEVILSLKAANGTTEVGNRFVTMSRTNAWETLSFDFTNLIGNNTVRFIDIIFDPNSKNVASPAARTYFYDNLQYSKLPEIALRNGLVEILNGDTLNVGSALLGDSVSLNVVVRNNGGSDLNLTGSPVFKFLGADSVHYNVKTTPQFTTLVGGGGATGFTLTFKPLSGGRKISAIRIANNDGDENPFFVNLKATATCATPTSLANAVTTPNATICSATNTSVSVATTQVGFNYQAFIGATAIGSAVAGNGATLLITIPSASLSNGANTITVRTSQLGCTPATLTNSASITVNKAPAITNTVTAVAASICQGTNGVVTIAASELGVSYQALVGTTNAGTPVLGTGASINLTIPAASLATGANTISVTANIAGCTQATLTAKPVITVNAPVAPTIALANITKTFGDAAFSLAATSNSLGAITYSLVNSTPASIVTVSSAGLVTISGAGTATLRASQVADACFLAGTRDITLTINKAARTVTITSGSAVQAGNTLALTGTIAPAVGSITWAIVSQTGTSASITGSTLTAGSASGTLDISATVATDANYLAATVSQTVTVSALATPVITFADITKTYGDAAFTVLATSTSNGAISYSIPTQTPTGIVSISGNTITILGAGTATVRATQVASGTFAGGTKDVTLTIGKKGLVVTADNKTIVYGNTLPAYTVSYAGFVGTDNESVLDTKPVATSLAISTSNAGVYDINAANGLDNNYSFTYVKGTLTIQKATRTVSITSNSTVQVGGSLTLTSTTTPTGGTVTYAITTLGTTNATVTGATLTAGSATGTLVLTASVATDVNYNAATATQNITVSAQTPPVITFGDITKTYGDPAFSVTATSTSNGAITYSVPTQTPAGIVSISGNTITILGAGTATIRASQASAGTFAAASKDITLTINKKVLTVTAEGKSIFYGDALPAYTFTYAGFVGTENESVIDTKPVGSSVATATSDAGFYDITVANGLDNNYSFVYVKATLEIKKATRTVNITSGSSVQANSTLSLTGNTSPAGGTITWSIQSQTGTSASITGSTLTAGTATGSLVVLATVPADVNYLVATTTQTVTVSALSTPTITFADVTKTFGDADFNMTATSNSNGAITYSIVTGGTFATINSTSGLVNITGAGVVTVRASVAANGSFAASSKTATLTINKANRIVVITSKNTEDEGKTLSLTATVTPTAPVVWSVTNNTGAAAVNGSTLILNSDGIVTVIATVAADANYDDAVVTQSFTITPVTDVNDIMFEPTEISPNPSVDEFNLVLGSNVGTSVVVNVKNALGENVLELKNVNSRNVRLDLNNVASGVYFVEIKSTAGTQLRRIVKQ